ncbi:glycoside hydrolase family 16 protein [Aaosphaeria arxii CBS 175.79]|uniref:Glycoside hydrolase family 16 protein n=1 Tax=Aaosphaeria arxii CBS 175.79 TaxID=1450172 RepID=A0A6A5XFI1_9PLEO|nr:glycoside hydrolase family 16 protein [Aaosphaeria arxii CBS 175.79]KAF2011703.1 glycoside hydrolase family 16 protein [Aaosphaeria arxii CBS 175.79]
MHPHILRRPHTALAAFLSLGSVTVAQENGGSGYSIQRNMSYDKFWEHFNFYSGPDPTEGHVQYLPKEKAFDLQLAANYDDTGSVYLGADSMNSDPKGRESVRVEGNFNLNQGLLIADIAHMPTNECGSWPAFWLLGQEEWPKGGEIDILEGVNDLDRNAVTLHTSEKCIVDNSTSGDPNASPNGNTQDLSFSGHLATKDCDVNAADQGKNVGCSIKALPGNYNLTFPDLNSNFTVENITRPPGGNPPTYGANYNYNVGGAWATEILSKSITTWFIPFPDTEKINWESPDISTFGKPIAKFTSTECDFEQRFKDMRIIFNIAFCGQWAGKEWESGGCAAKTGVGSCNDYVSKYPEKFRESYFEIYDMYWYEKGGNGNSTMPAPSGSQSSALSSTQTTGAPQMEATQPGAVPTGPPASESSSSSSVSSSSSAAPGSPSFEPQPQPQPQRRRRSLVHSSGRTYKW